MMTSSSNALGDRSAPPATWQMTLGANVESVGVRFRVWAPKRARVDVVLEDDGRSFPLLKDEAGYFSGLVPIARAGMRYRYRLDNGEAYPDPCSRYQPEGPHGPSLIVDPSAYEWQTTGWPGVHMPGQVIYELHVGTFTPEGTLDAAIGQLEELKDFGVTLIELMPMAEFPGRWNWGYDGVDLFAPAHVYGDPHALKRFVDAAHARGLGVILDVVYNHFGPDGNYLPVYSDQYVTDRHPNEWGQAVNYDGPGSAGVRDFVVQNACYWISEFRFDGLRLDAVHAIYDDSPLHVLAEMSKQARAVASERSIVLIAECESQLIETVRPIEAGGWGLDGVWSDDFHHVCRVAMTGRSEAYFTDYRGTAQELLSVIKRGFLYQGQRYEWQKKSRGTVVKNEPAHAFVFYLQNHDQVANHLSGDRIHAFATPGRYRALVALMLLAPETPLLFMGQEFGASTRFLFFADHHSDLAAKVYEGRKKFLCEFPEYATPEAQKAVPDPADARTFEQSRLDFSERRRHAALYRLHRDLLALRREDRVLAAAQHLSRSRGDTAGVAHAVNLMASANMQRGDLDAAEALFHRAQALSEAANDAPLEAIIAQNLGVVTSMRGDAEAALGHYQHSLATYRAQRLGDYVAPVLNNMALVYMSLERWDDAERCNAEALVEATRCGDPVSSRMIEVNAVEMWVTRGEVRRAASIAHRVMDLAVAAGDSRVIDELSKNLGAICRVRGEHDAAVRWLDAAYRGAMKREDLLLAAETAREQAELYEVMGRNQETLRALGLSHRLYGKLKATRRLADIATRVERLERRFYDIVHRWAQTIESKDPYTLGHCERVAEYACALAREIGLEDLTMFWFRIGALLHDVGKIEVPSEILTKNGPLTAEERAIMERHAAIGADLLRDIEFPWDVLPMIRSHHERWDGKGYPDRLSGEEIPLTARVLCIADVFDALASDRPYRAAFPRDEALAIMQKDVGKAFDPALFERFLAVVMRPGVAMSAAIHSPQSAIG